MRSTLLCIAALTILGSDALAKTWRGEREPVTASLVERSKPFIGVEMLRYRRAEPAAEWIVVRVDLERASPRFVFSPPGDATGRWASSLTLAGFLADEPDVNLAWNTVGFAPKKAFSGEPAWIARQNPVWWPNDGIERPLPIGDRSRMVGLVDDRLEVADGAQLKSRHPTWAVGGFAPSPALVDGQIVTYPDKRHPRALLGTDADGGTLLLMVVDGRTASSQGLTMHEAADAFRQAGAHEAEFLDGGGSVAAGVRKGGSYHLINTPVGLDDLPGTLRPTAVYMGIANLQPTDEPTLSTWGTGLLGGARPIWLALAIRHPAYSVPAAVAALLVLALMAWPVIRFVRRRRAWNRAEREAGRHRTVKT